MKIKLLNNSESKDVINVRKRIYLEFEDGKFSTQVDKEYIDLYKVNKENDKNKDEFVFIHNIMVEDLPAKMFMMSAPINEYKSINNAIKNIAKFIKMDENLDVIIDLSKKCLDADLMKKLVEGLYINLYTFDKYKAKKSEIAKNIYIICDVQNDIKNAFDEGSTLGRATCLVKQLVNEPANVMLPERIAEEAIKAGDEYGFDVTVYGKKEIEQINMPAYL